MRGYDRTEAGGPDELFHTTRWSDIARARTLDEPRRRATLGELLHRYWKPVYCYLRRKGHDNETAKDLTQGFFQEVVLGRELIQKAEAERGRFRTLLLTALDRYVTSVHRADAAKKRSPEARQLSIEMLGPDNVPEPAPTETPAEAFGRSWVAGLLDAALAATEHECAAAGMATHWQVFRERVIAPILDGAEPGPMSELCARLGVRSESTASNMIVTVKRRFQAVLRREVRQFVASEAEVDEEIRSLVGLLSKRGAG